MAVPPDDFDPQARPSRFAANALTMIARALGPDVRYLVHAYPVHQSVIEQVLTSAGAKDLYFAPSAHGFYTRWTRDMFLVRAQSRGRVWLLPKQILRRLDDSVGSEVAAELGREARQMPLNVEGGNLISFGAWVFAGKDLLLDGRTRIDTERRRTLKGLLAPDHNWIWVGNDRPIPHAAATGVFQPLFHIDMFVTPVLKAASARPHIIVGSTTLAEELVGRPDPLNVGPRLDEIAAHLRRAGFTVSRIPLLVIRDAGVISIISYNNVLFDGANARTVIMPHYATSDRSLRAADEFAVDHYQRLGYIVRLVNGPLLELGRQLGGLRCLIQVTARD